MGRYLNETAGESFAFQLATNFYSNQNPEMATVVSLSSISPNLNLNSKNFTSQPTYSRKLSRVRCNVENSSTKGEPEPRNALLKIAWYGSELLGIAASFLRSPSPSDVENDLKLATDGSGAAELDRATVVEAIKEDFARSYFVTGNLTLDAYEEDCEFADPAGSFKGLRRFKRNCTNFGLLIDKSNMNLTRWDDFENGPDDFVCDQLNMIEQAERIFFYIDAGLMELLALNCIWAQDKGIGHWRFNCIMSFPWRPILSATGYTEYYFNAETGRVCRHVEHWNVPKMALFKQILRPSRVGRRKSGG